MAMIFPAVGRGRPRQRHIPDMKSITAQAMLEKAQWRPVSGRRGAKGRLLNLPADTPLKQIAGAIRARWVCEQRINSSRRSLASTTSRGAHE